MNIELASRVVEQFRTYGIRKLETFKAVYMSFHSFNKACGFDLVTSGFQLVTRGFELITRGFERVTCVFELALLNFNSYF